MDTSGCRVYSKQKLEYMNYDSKYGGPWITFANDVSKTNEYKLYATNQFCNLTSGREYIAIRADKVITKDDIIKYDLVT